MKSLHQACWSFFLDKQLDCLVGGLSTFRVENYSELDSDAHDA